MYGNNDVSDMSRESKLPISEHGKAHSPDRMVNSCNVVTSNDMASSMIGNEELMTRSLDPALLFTSASQDPNLSDQSESSSARLVLEDCTAGK